MLVGELISGLDIRPLPRLRAGRSGAEGAGRSPESIRICDITEDSRTALPGSLFIARRGLTEDGRRFVPQAVRAGAVAVLTDDEALSLPGAGGRGPDVAVLVAPDVNLAAARLAERFYGSPSSKLDLVGVTGTNGKTTITYLVHRLLNGLGRRCGMISTVQIDDGVGVADAVLTTPPAIEISRTLSVMVEAGCGAAVMEVSSHALDQHRAAALAFDVAIFTNLTGDHLDYHGTMDAYAAAKARLFEMLPPTGLAVVNAMDPWHERMIRGCRARVLRCAIEGSPAAAPGGGAECVARIDREMVRSTAVTLRGPWGVIEAELPLIGPHNVMNALQAVAAAWHIAPWTAAEGDTDPIGLASVAAPPGRLQLVSTADQPIAVYVDYAHSDDALRNVLTVLRRVVDASPAPPRGERPLLWCVFGCGGDRDRTKRPRMGAVAAELADRVVITSDNPRTEEPRSIIDQVAAGALGVESAALGENVFLEEDRERAIRLAVRRAAPGDIILIAGKGHETYQILPDGRGGTIRRDFDDRLVARDALRLRFGEDAAELPAAGPVRRRRTPPSAPRRHDPPAPPQHPSRSDPS